MYLGLSDRRQFMTRPLYRVSTKKSEKSNLKTDDMEKHDISKLRTYKFSDSFIVCWEPVK